MKQITIIVQTRSGSTEWPAYMTNTPGLAVCRSPWEDYDNPGQYTPGDTWRVVHIGSGKKLPQCYSFKTRRDASLMAYALKTIVDWKLDEEGLNEASRHDKATGKAWSTKFAEIKRRIFGE